MNELTPRPVSGERSAPLTRLGRRRCALPDGRRNATGTGAPAATRERTAWRRALCPAAPRGSMLQPKFAVVRRELREASRRPTAAREAGRGDAGTRLGSVQTSPARARRLVWQCAFVGRAEMQLAAWGSSEHPPQLLKLGLRFHGGRRRIGGRARSRRGRGACRLRARGRGRGKRKRLRHA